MIIFVYYPEKVTKMCYDKKLLGTWFPCFYIYISKYRVTLNSSSRFTYCFTVNQVLYTIIMPYILFCTHINSSNPHNICKILITGLFSFFSHEDIELYIEVK